MAEPYSREFLLSILNALPDGLEVCCLGRDGIVRTIFRNTKAADFAALGSAAPCVQTAKKVLTFPAENVFVGEAAGAATSASSSDTAGTLMLTVTSNPFENGAVKAVIDAIPEVIYFADPRTGSVNFVNKFWREGEGANFSGHGMSWTELLHPDDRVATAEAWNASMASLEPYQAEYRTFKGPEKDVNDVRYMRGRAGHVLNAQGQSVMVAGQMIDQTEGVVNRRLLAQEKSFLDTALDAVPVGVVVSKLSGSGEHAGAADLGTVVVGNRAMSRIWRSDAFPLRELRGYSDHVAFKQDGSRVQAHEWPLARSLLGETIVDEDIIAHRFDGSEGVLRISSAPVRDPASGAIIGAVAAIVDVTDQLRAEKDKLARVAAEEAAVQMKRLVANVSHEVRTPIAGVIGLVSLLEQSNLDDEQRELVDGIKDSGQLLLSVVNDLLDHSKIEEGKMELEKAPLSVKALLRHITLLSAEITSRKNIRLETHLDPTLPPAVVQSDLRLKQVLLNLLSNAAKFTPPGGTISIEVRAEPCESVQTDDTTVTADPSGATVSAVSTAAGNLLHDDINTQHNTAPTSPAVEREDGSDVSNTTDGNLSVVHSPVALASSSSQRGPFVKLYFKVRDTGIGLTADQITRLFRRFTQADASTARRFGGSGLGLALCRELVKLMGGSISVESEGEGKGSCFSFHVVAELCDIQATKATPRSAFLASGSAGSADEPSSPTPASSSSAPVAAGPQLPTCSAGTSPRVVPDRPQSLGLLGRVGAMLRRSSSRSLGASAKASDSAPSPRANAVPDLTGGGSGCWPPSPKGTPLLSSSTDKGYQSAASTPKPSLPPIFADRTRRPTTQVDHSPLLAAPGVDAPKSQALAVTPSLAPLSPSASIFPDIHKRVEADDGPSATKQARILVVDDSSVNRQILRKSLQRLGYANVALACDGAEAVAMVKDDKEGFDIVFCDLMMPVMGGADAAAAIKALPSPKRRAVPVVMVSALADATGHAEGLFFDRLPKPFDATDLSRVLTKCLASCDSGATASP